MSRREAPDRPRLVIGLTGGLASGKSTAAARFESLGTPVLDADDVARGVVEPGQPALGAIIDAFGPSVLGSDGRLDRAQVRDIVFADDRRRRQLEAIVHPRVRDAMVSWLAGVDAPYAVLVVPLLLESGQSDLVDRVVVVDLPVEEQVERAARRDGVTPASARRIVDAQWGREARLRHADDVLDNTGSPEALLQAVDRLHRRYLRRARQVASHRD